MDIVQILFISAVIVPAISALVIMLFIKYSKGGLKSKKLGFEQKEIAYKEKEKRHKKIITSLEKVVETQDTVLDGYRDTQSN